MEKILHLTLKKKWFDMILSGEKTEEYRDIKPYWDKRLIGNSFDIIRFRNGYKKDSSTFDIECKGISKGFGWVTWGAPKINAVYIIKLGKRLDKQP